jgi:glutathione S-transferase
VPIFGSGPEEAGVIMRVICEFMAYAEPSLLKIVSAIFAGQVDENIDELTDAMHIVAREARTIEGRLSKEQWIVGARYSATDMVIFPWIQVLRRALDRSAAASLSARFLPMERNYPALARWIQRIEALPGYERTYPPHWRLRANLRGPGRPRPIAARGAHVRPEPGNFYGNLSINRAAR